MDVRARTLATIQAGSRVAIGLALTAAPQRAGTAWIGGDAGHPGTQLLTAALGARDLAIGLGALAAVRQGFGARPWLGAGMLADAVDLVVTVRARRELSPLAVAGVAVAAGGSVALSAYLLREVD